MHKLAILATHGVTAADLAIASEVFGRVTGLDGRAAYDVRVCGEAAEVRSRAFNIRAPWRLAEAAEADTVIVPGSDNPLLPVPDPVIQTIRGAAGRGARVASVCTGAFALAATGLLDGRRATTHWLLAPMLAARYPAVTVDPNVLFIDNGQLLTSAGASAGVDLCLHMIRRDLGQAIAAKAARLAVAPLEREGGQAQFIVHESVARDANLAPVLTWMEENARAPLTLQQIADRAGTSHRTLNRRFKAQLGTTPIQWLLAARIRRAQALLETSSLSIDQIALETGFEGSASLRERFSRVVGVSPKAYRRTFSGTRVPGAAALDQRTPTEAGKA